MATPTDDPLAGLDDLVSSTLSALGAPPPGLDVLAPAGSKAGNEDGSKTAEATVDMFGMAFGDLSSAAPAASNMLDITDIDLDLLSTPSVSAAAASGSAAKDPVDLGAAFSLSLADDIPLNPFSATATSPRSPPAVSPAPAPTPPAPLAPAPTPEPAVADAFNPFSDLSPPSSAIKDAGSFSSTSPAPAPARGAQPDLGPLNSFPSGASSLSHTHQAQQQPRGDHDPLVGSGASSSSPAGAGVGAAGAWSTAHMQRGSSTSGAAQADGEEHPVKVWVRDPEKVEVSGFLRTTHYVYTVRTEATLASLRAEGTEVRRRFSEFDALHKLLRVHSRGYVIPPVPEKSFLEARLGQDDFLRLRRADLQAFLRAIVTHPVLREAEAVRLFLLQPGELQYNPAWLALGQTAAASKALLFGDPVAIADAHAAAGGYSSVPGSGVASTPFPISGQTPGASTTTKAGAALAGLVSWVRHSVMAPASASRHAEELDDEERHLRQAKELMKDLGRLLQLCCENARALCAHSEAFAHDLGELGRNMGMLSKWEEALLAHSGTYTPAGASAQRRAADAKNLAYAVARQHGLWKNAAVKTAASLVPLHDYFILVPEAVSALDERERLLERVWELTDELEAKRASLNSGRGGRSTSAHVDRLEESLRAARDAYGVVKQRNQSELLRLQLCREKDFRVMAATFTQVQAQLVQASADMWRMTAAHLAGGEGGEGGASRAAGEGDAGTSGQGSGGGYVAAPLDPSPDDE